MILLKIAAVATDTDAAYRPGDMWAPDRYVQAPQSDSSVVVPGHWERRLSDREVWTPPFVGATPDGNVMNFPAGVRLPAHERQAP